MVAKSPIWDLFYTDGTKYKSNQTHSKSWCLACVAATVARLQGQNIIATAQGSALPLAYTEEEWRTAACQALEPLCGKPKDLRKHAEKCNHINSSATKTAERDAVIARMDASARATNVTSSDTSFAHPQPIPGYTFPPFASPPPGSSTSFGSPLPTYSPLPPESPHLDGPPSKRRRTSSVFSQAPRGWSVDEQEVFSQDLCKLFVTCRWSWNTIENPEFKMFFDKYVPDAKLPDRRVLSGRILTGEAEKVVQRTRQLTDGKLATYSEDGWTNIAKTHVDTSLISVEAQPFLLRTHDMTGRPKTGDELFSIMKSDFQYAQDTYGVEIICACTDDGPDGKKARRLIKEQLPWIAAFECWAHQSSLITGNYLAIKAPWMNAAKLAVEIIKWFNNHGTALDLLRAAELTTFGRWLALILPVLTRWVSQYCALRRLIKLKRAVLICIIQHEERLLVCAGRKDEQMATAAHIIETCKDDDFWKNIERITTHIEPLAIASNILQSPTCRLDTVLLCLGNLYRIFRNLPTTDSLVKRAVHASLERRWGKTDQELMILGVFFNPYIRSRAFNPDSLSCINIFHIARRAYERLLRQRADGDVEFMQAFQSYYDDKDYFSSETMWIEGHRQAYEASKKPVDLLPLWKRMDGGSLSLTGRSGFVKLAIRIISMLPNSAGPERIFSFYGLTHTKHRNRLGPEKVHDATLVRNDRQRAHIEAGKVTQRRPRRFSLADDRAEMEAMERAAASDSGTDSTSTSVDVDFNSLAEILVDLATQEEDEDDEEPTPEPSAVSNRPSASTSVTNANMRIPAYKKIKLEHLFNYPPAGTPATELDFFWKGGERSLDDEEEEFELEAQRAAEAQMAAAAGAGPVVSRGDSATVTS
ncbi:ribonuclease H-like domain-containing protein [Mycena rebaudengoi]|nr:ribonuclease H-like domain-containing protein [Mycena rebaudengoi]